MSEPAPAPEADAADDAPARRQDWLSVLMVIGVLLVGGSCLVLQAIF